MREPSSRGQLGHLHILRTYFYPWNTLPETPCCFQVSGRVLLIYNLPLLPAFLWPGLWCFHLLSDLQLGAWVERSITLNCFHLFLCPLCHFHISTLFLTRHLTTSIPFSSYFQYLKNHPNEVHYVDDSNDATKQLITILSAFLF